MFVEEEVATCKTV